MSKPQKKVKITRADKAEATRHALFAAATKVVGKVGYADASINKITTEARVAQGTFYNYFESRKDLFDQLLPALGKDLLDFIRSRVKSEKNGLKREELGLRAFFEFLLETPQFYRILNESEVFAPVAYEKHMQNMANGYLRALNKSWEKGSLSGFSKQELEVIVYILLSARNYLSMHYSYSKGVVQPVPESVISTYMKIVSGGFGFGSEQDDSSVFAYWKKKALNTDTQKDTKLRYSVVRNEGREIVLDIAASNIRLDANGAPSYSYIVDIIDAIARLQNLLPGSPRTLQPRSLSVTFSKPNLHRKQIAIGAVEVIAPDAILLTLQLRAGEVNGSLNASAQGVYNLSS